jgi:hypothetical protein
MVDTEEIKQMAVGGMTIASIAEEVGVTAQYISQILKAQGIEKAKPRRTVLSRLEDGEIERCINEYLEGAPVHVLLYKYKINYNALYTLLRENNVELRSSKANKEVREERIRRAIELYLEGVLIADIEAETGIRQPVLHKELHQRHVPLRRGRGGKVKRKEPLERYDIDLDDYTSEEIDLLLPEDDPTDRDVSDMRKEIQQRRKLERAAEELLSDEALLLSEEEEEDEIAAGVYSRERDEYNE